MGCWLAFYVYRLSSKAGSQRLIPMTVVVRWQHIMLLGLSVLLLGCDASPAPVAGSTGVPSAPSGTLSPYPLPSVEPYPFPSPLATLERTAVPPTSAPAPEGG